MDSGQEPGSAAKRPPGTERVGESTVASTRADELSRLFEQHNRHLVSFLAERLGNDAEAREVAQEAYVRLLQLDQPGAISFLRAYLYRTASNLAVDRIRRRTEPFADAFDAEDPSNRITPERSFLARESLDILRRALLELPASHRRAFQLSRFEHRSTAEIGRILGLESTQTRLYLRRAIAYCALRISGAGRAEAEKGIFR